MAYTVKACTKSSYRRKSSVIIAVVAVLSCAAVALAFYNLAKAKYLFTVSYLIAAFLGVTYVIIRSNTVYKTYIATDRRSIYMRRWVNHFMPYNFDCKIKIVREFIPAKTELAEVPVGEIEGVYIGTKNYIKKYAGHGFEFADDIERFEKSSDFTVKRLVQTMDIFYIETFGGECMYMPITEFNVSAVIKILKYINRLNPRAEFFIYSRDYRRFKPITAPVGRG